MRRKRCESEGERARERNEQNMCTDNGVTKPHLTVAALLGKSFPELVSFLLNEPPLPPKKDEMFAKAECRNRSKSVQSKQKKNRKASNAEKTITQYPLKMYTEKY